MLDNELRNYCDGIRADLEKLYNAEWTDEERDERENSGEACDLYEYLSDVLDIEYTVDSRGGYIASRIYVALGGPNIWIDTREECVRGAWGSGREESYIGPKISGAIDEIMEELYDMLRQ